MKASWAAFSQQRRKGFSGHRKLLAHVGHRDSGSFPEVHHQRLYPNDVSLREAPASAAGGTEAEIHAPIQGYLSLVIFVLSLLVAIFQPFGKMPVQTVLVAGALLMIVVCRIRLTDLMEGIILLPVTAMAAGFLAAGALAATVDSMLWESSSTAW